MIQLKNTIPAYEALAAIYDQVMAHVDYEYWAEYIHNVIQKHGTAQNIYDISCGTGTCCAELFNLGYQVWGSDVSWSMIKQAHEKFKLTPLKDHFFCSSMEHPSIRFQPDVIVSLYDSINYLLEPAQWKNCLANVARILKPGGLFIFDVSTVQNSKQDFANLVQKEHVANAYFLRKSFFNHKTNIQKNVFEIQFTDGLKHVFRETHVQKIRPLDEVIGFLTQSPLQFIAGYEEFTFSPYSENCERVHFVLIKPE